MFSRTVTTLRGAEKVKHAVHQWIKVNKPRQNDKFLSQRELARLLQVDPMTAHKALNELTGEGILYRIKGKGSFIGQVPTINKGLKLAFVMSGSHLEDPKNNPDSWHIVQRNNIAIIRALKENDSFSTIIIKPGNSSPRDITRLSKYDAVLFSGPAEFNQLIQKLINNDTTVIINGVSEECDLNCIKIHYSRVQGVNIGVSYLIERGYKKIAYIGSSEHDNSLKQVGYQQALKDYGLKLDEQLIVNNINHQNEGIKGAAILINRKVEFDAIFVDSDLKAVGVIEYLNQTGLKVPEDIGVMGFDGIEQCTGAPLYLTSVESESEQNIAIAVEFIRKNGNAIQVFDILPEPSKVIKNRTTK